MRWSFVIMTYKQEAFANCPCMTLITAEVFLQFSSHATLYLLKQETTVCLNRICRDMHIFFSLKYMTKDCNQFQSVSSLIHSRVIPLNLRGNSQILPINGLLIFRYKGNINANRTPPISMRGTGRKHEVTRWRLRRSLIS